MELRAYAKINLYLDVTAKRSDGYHDIVSIMQAVDLYDTVRIACTDALPVGITLHCDGGLPCDERNLAYRAAALYFGGDIPCHVTLDVQKRIPAEAGLAGGSADCAAVLRGLNMQFAKYSDQELLALGARLGADVPFCLVGGTQITRGIGERLQSCVPMPDCYLVIARGGQGVSTPWAYRALDEQYGDFAQQAAQSEHRLARILDAMQKKDLKSMTDAMYNVFESVVLPVHGVASVLKQEMEHGGAIAAMMSGSGPSIVGIFESESTAKQVCKQINREGIVAHVCRPVN